MIVLNHEQFDDIAKEIISALTRRNIDINHQPVVLYCIADAIFCEINQMAQEQQEQMRIDSVVERLLKL